MIYKGHFLNFNDFNLFLQPLTTIYIDLFYKWFTLFNFVLWLVFMS